MNFFFLFVLEEKLGLGKYPTYSLEVQYSTVHAYLRALTLTLSGRLRKVNALHCIVHWSHQSVLAEIHSSFLGFRVRQLDGHWEHSILRHRSFSLILIILIMVLNWYIDRHFRDASARRQSICFDLFRGGISGYYCC